MGLSVPLPKGLNNVQWHFYVHKWVSLVESKNIIKQLSPLYEKLFPINCQQCWSSEILCTNNHIFDSNFISLKLLIFSFGMLSSCECLSSPSHAPIIDWNPYAPSFPCYDFERWVTGEVRKSWGWMKVLLNGVPKSQPWEFRTPCPFHCMKNQWGGSHQVEGAFIQHSCTLIQDIQLWRHNGEKEILISKAN